MKVLLDHCVDRRFARMLPDHEVLTAAQMGWDAHKNGRLLSAAALAGFAVMVTTDKNIRREQNLDVLPVPVVQLDSIDTRLKALLLIGPHLQAALAETTRYRFIIVGQAGVGARLSPRGGK